jgi:biotin carboxylase
MDRPVTLVCLASYFKGARLIEAAKEAGARVILVTNEKLQDAPWPMDAIDERFLLPDVNRQPDVTNAVAFLARTRRIDRILALDEFDTVTGAQLREHLRIPGLGDTTGRYFRDKLAMRMLAREAGIPVPDFVPAINDDELAAFMDRVPGPWLLKPRTEASAMGIRRIDAPEALWPLLEALGDRRSWFLMEAYVPGDVYHVDSIVSGRRPAFSSVSRYGRPPLDVYHGGGVFVTRTVRRDDEAHAELTRANERLLEAFGMVRGATHAEFIRSRADGTYRFIEVAARVGGAHIDLLVEHATGVNLWAEWARTEIADVRGESYRVEQDRALSTGLIVCLARDEHPDLSSYDDPEIVWRLRKKHHAGVIVASPDPARVDELLDRYLARFTEEFLAVRPPLGSAAEMGQLE